MVKQHIIFTVSSKSRNIFLIISTFLLISTLVSPLKIHAQEDIAQKQEITTLIAGVIKAYGGEDAIKNINDVYAKGTISATMRGGEGTYVRYFKRNRMLRVETVYSSLSEIRVLNGTNGWRGTVDGPLPSATGFRYLAMVYQYKQLDLPYGLLTKAYIINRTGEESINGRNLKVLEIEDFEGPPIKVYIDPAKYYIVKVTGQFRIAGKIAELSAEFSDFREIKGIPFPYHISNYGSGHKVGETVIEKYVLDSPMDISLFNP